MSGEELRMLSADPIYPTRQLEGAARAIRADLRAAVEGVAWA